MINSWKTGNRWERPTMSLCRISWTKSQKILSKRRLFLHAKVEIIRSPSTPIVTTINLQIAMLVVELTMPRSHARKIAILCRAAIICTKMRTTGKCRISWGHWSGHNPQLISDRIRGPSLGRKASIKLQRNMKRHQGMRTKMTLSTNCLCKIRLQIRT